MSRGGIKYRYEPSDDEKRASKLAYWINDACNTGHTDKFKNIDIEGVVALFLDDIKTLSELQIIKKRLEHK